MVNEFQLRVVMQGPMLDVSRTIQDPYHAIHVLEGHLILPILVLIFVWTLFLPQERVGNVVDSHVKRFAEIT